MNTKHILIIEDDRRFRGAIKNALAGKGGLHYDFVEAASNREGIDALKNNPEIRVVLLDLGLPDGSGEKFLEQIRDEARKYRVIILTAHDEYLDSDKAREFFVFNYLPKTNTAFTQSIRFSVDQAFKDIEREQLKDKNETLIEIQTRINLDLREGTTNQQTLETLHNVLELICRSLRSLIGAYTCHIRLYNLNTGQYDLAAFDGPHETIRAVFESPKRKDEPFSGMAASAKAPVLFRNLQNDLNFKAFKDESLKRSKLIQNDVLLIEMSKYFAAIESVFVTPITTRMFADEVDALFNVSGDSADFFSNEKQEIIKEFVTQATIAITKAWLKQRKQQTHQDYKGISRVLEDISKELGAENAKRQIYDIAIKGISAIIKPEAISLYLYNKSTGLLDNEAEFRGLERFEPGKEGHPTGKGLTALVYSSGKPLRVPNLQQGDWRKPREHESAHQDLYDHYVRFLPSGRVDHFLGVPMIIGDEVIGAIQLLNKRSAYYDEQIDQGRWLLERGFSEDCESVLAIAASHLAVAIRNADLLEERRKQISQLATLKDVGRFISSETLGDLLRKIIHEAAADAQAELCLLFLLDESKTRVVLQQRYGISEDELPAAEYEIGEGLTGQVAKTGQSVLQSADVQTGKYDHEIEGHLKTTYGEAKRIESLMIVPIKAAADTLGVIEVINKKGIDQHYNLADLTFFEAFASYVGIAIENAQLYESAVRKLATAESNSTLSNLVASVAHEINNTYGLIPESVDELRNALPETADPETAELLDEIEELAMQMVYYANEIGGYSIGKRGEQAILNLNDVVHTALQQIPEFRKPRNFASISLVQNLVESALVCCLHESPLIRTIRNIVINAFQALEGKATGEIVVATRKDIGAGLAIIEITDNGCGIRPEYVERIFDPEFTSKPGKGSGIGLWLAKRHLDSIGGSIAFTSIVGQGTTFMIGVPLGSKMVTEA